MASFLPATAEAADSTRPVSIPPPLPPSIPPAPVSTPASDLHPVSIAISSADTDVPIIPVGLTKTGNLDVPHNFVQAGWYDLGALPGGFGSAVIDGHVDNGGSIPGVFKHLDQAKPGDSIVVTMSDGTSRAFTVTESDVYDYRDFPSNLVFNQAGGQFLKIITCHGTFLPGQDTYDQRLVVTAVLDPLS